MVQVDTFLTEVAASYRYAVHNLLPGASGVGRPPAGDAPAANNTEARVGRPRGAARHPAASGRRRSPTTVRGEADSDAATVAPQARADLEAAELHQAAERRSMGQAKRRPTHAQEQADTIVAEAEEQAHTLVEQRPAERARRGPTAVRGDARPAAAGHARTVTPPGRAEPSSNACTRCVRTSTAPMAIGWRWSRSVRSSTSPAASRCSTSGLLPATVVTKAMSTRRTMTRCAR